MGEKSVYKVYSVTHGLFDINRELIGTYSGREDKLAMIFIEHEILKRFYLSGQKPTAIPIIRYENGAFPKEYKYMQQKSINRFEIITLN